MRIVVLNGVNLDALGRRPAELYGGLTLSELETRIYEWAAELDCTVRCRQTNHEGEFVDWCHDALDWAEGAASSPGSRGQSGWARRGLLSPHTSPLVTAPLNLRYLTGFRSSNAALLVEPDAGATLYSDFRYAKRAREVEGVTFV